MYEYDYQDLEDQLTDWCDQADPVMIHGHMSGLICSGIQLSLDFWLDEAARISGATESPSTEVKQILSDWQRAIPTGMTDLEMSYQLVLPGENTPMSERLEALIDWIQSFLGGLVSSGKIEQLSQDAKEGLEDLIEISHVDVESAVEDGAETDFFALVEHVRLVVISLMLEMNPKKDDSAAFTH